MYVLTTAAMQVMLYITATTETITAVVWLLQLPYVVNDSKILFRTLLFSIVTHFMALIGSCVHTYVCMYVSSTGYVPRLAFTC